MIFWIITWVLLVANLALGVFRLVTMKDEIEKAIAGLELRLKQSAAIRSAVKKTYAERLADEYAKRGISG